MKINEKPLGDVALIIMGTSPKGDTYNDVGIGMPLLNGPTEFGPNNPSCTLYTTDPKRECEVNDLIFCVRGSTTGRMNWADKKYALGRGVCSFRGETKEDTIYIRYALEMKLTALLQFAGGSTFPNLTKDAINDFFIPFPESRGNIVSVISKYDELIENNRRRIELLEESARQLYKEWFVRFRFPGHEHVKIIDGVPEGWSFLELSEAVAVIKDTVDPKNIPEETPYLGLEHFPRRSFTLKNWESAGKVTSTKYAFQTGDILFGKIRPYFHKVGFSLVDGITSSDAIVMRPRLKKYYFIVLSEVSSDQFVALASKTVREGSKMPRADWDVLKKRVILEPPQKTLDVFNNQLESILSQCKLLSFQMANLAKARDLLLPKLMSGEIAV